VRPNPNALLQCCYLVDGEARLPDGVADALQTNGIAPVYFSSLSLDPQATAPRWLSHAFLGCNARDLVVALRDACQPGYFQSLENCDILRRYFFSELKQFGHEWGEPARYFPIPAFSSLSLHTHHLFPFPYHHLLLLLVVFSSSMLRPPFISHPLRLALKQLPIHRIGSLNPGKSMSPCAGIDDEHMVVGPSFGSTSIQPEWLDSHFITPLNADDEAGYTILCVRKVSATQWYMHHLFPHLDDYDPNVRVAALQRMLDTMEILSHDGDFVEWVRQHGKICGFAFCFVVLKRVLGRFVTGSGSIVHVRQLVVPWNASSALLMDISRAPARELASSAYTHTLINLGAQSSPGIEDVKRASSALAAVAKSGWNEDVDPQCHRHLPVAVAAVECLPSFFGDVSHEQLDAAFDCAARTISAIANLLSCASLKVTLANLTT
jgi:hypothetical protein